MATDDLLALLQRSARGDQVAFAGVYDATSAQVYGLVLRVVRDPAHAAEVVQECYLQVWQSAPQFDGAHGSATDWILTLAHRRAVDRVRSALGGPGTSTDIGADVGERTEEERSRTVLGELTATQREAIELAYLGGYTHSEVDELLQVPLGTAKSRLRDGLLRSRDLAERGERR